MSVHGSTFECTWEELTAQGVTPSADDEAVTTYETLNLDQGMLALLVANIWDITTQDMQESRARVLRLFSGESCFTNRRTGSATPTVSLFEFGQAATDNLSNIGTNFENFLSIRGDEVEQRRWNTIKSEAQKPGGGNGRLLILPMHHCRRILKLPLRQNADQQ